MQDPPAIANLPHPEVMQSQVSPFDIPSALAGPEGLLVRVSPPNYGSLSEGCSHRSAHVRLTAGLLDPKDDNGGTCDKQGMTAVASEPAFRT